MSRPRNHPGRGPGVYVKTDTVLRKVEGAFASAAAFCIFALMAIGVIQIAGRQIFNAPIFGYIDIVELLIAPLAFLAISYAERAGDHVRMELLIGRLHGRLLWAVQLIGVLIGLFLIAVLIRYGFDHALRAYRFGDITIDAGYLWWPSKLVVPVSLSLLWLRLLLMAFGFSGLIIRPAPEPPGLTMAAEIEKRDGPEKTQAQTDVDMV